MHVLEILVLNECFVNLLYFLYHTEYWVLICKMNWNTLLIKSILTYEFYSLKHFIYILVCILCQVSIEFLERIDFSGYYDTWVYHNIALFWEACRKHLFRKLLFWLVCLFMLESPYSILSLIHTFHGICSLRNKILVDLNIVCTWSILIFFVYLNHFSCLMSS